MAVPGALRRRIRELDASRCSYCRAPEALSVSAFEIDHIIPESAGGTAVEANLCFACPACNRFKSSRQTVPDSLTGASVPLFHPRRDNWSDHFAWDDEGVVIDGLTATGRATVVALRMNRPPIIRLRRLWAKIGFDMRD